MRPLFPLVGLLIGFSSSALADTSKGSLTKPKLEMVWTDKSQLDPLAAESEISKILFVNRCKGGCTFTKGNNDARANTSSIVAGSRTLSEFAGSDEEFDAVIECMKEVYGPYDVQIVTEDPGTEVFHHEVVLAGTALELGKPGIGGIAPGGCEPLNNVISFSLANEPYAIHDIEWMCSTTAQESAHSYGLPNHAYDCTDPMTYLSYDPETGQSCGRKYFRNKDMGCGDPDQTGQFVPMPCRCGSPTSQNSHVELTKTFGPGKSPEAPEVSLIAISENQQIKKANGGFTLSYIRFKATNRRGISNVELWINGVKYASMAAFAYPDRNDEYNIDYPTNLPDGVWDIEVKAIDDLGTVGVAKVTVLKGEPCASKDVCDEFMECSEGRCKFPAPLGVLGDACEYDQFCTEGVCAEAQDGQKACATQCVLNIPNACDDGFECLETTAAGKGACFPGGAGEGGGGCCNVGQAQNRPVWPSVLLSALVLLALAFRSKSRQSVR